MMKKIFNLALVLLVTASVFAEEVKIDGLWYEIIAKAKEAIVIKKNYEKYVGDIVIPSIIKYEGDEYSVTSIRGAFSGSTGLTSITIPASVTSIDGSAFSGCSSLTSVTIPDGVTSIGNYAFSGCSGLTSITIPNGVTSIGMQAFQNCSGLTSITIGNGVTSIGLGAFSGCSGLRSLVFGDNLEQIDSDAFAGCTALTGVHVPSLSVWCKIVFKTSYSNPLSYAHHLYIDNEEIEDVVIPEGVSRIEPYAFSGCLGMTSLTISNGVTDIGYSAFSDCNGLTSIFIPNSVITIGGSAFKECSALTSITIPNSVTTIGNITKKSRVRRTWRLFP